MLLFLKNVGQIIYFVVDIKLNLNEFEEWEMPGNEKCSVCFMQQIYFEFKMSKFVLNLTNGSQLIRNKFSRRIVDL